MQKKGIIFNIFGVNMEKISSYGVEKGKNTIEWEQ